MQQNFEQVKLNIPKTERQVIDYCKGLSAQRLLSETVIRLINQELEQTNRKK